jgi:hypothetical protein
VSERHDSLDELDVLGPHLNDVRPRLSPPRRNGIVIK